MGYVLCLMAGAVLGMVLTSLLVASSNYDKYDMGNEEKKDADR